MTQSKRPSRIMRALKIIFKGLFWTTTAGLMLAIGAVAGAYIIIDDTAKKLPKYSEIREIPNGTTIRYFSDDDQLLYTQGPEYGQWVEYKDIPVEMRQAIIAVEDRRYREHYGVDPVALARAAKFAWDNRNTGRRLQGASTITQQVARMLFLDRSYDMRRKIDEMIVALALEQVLTKEQILELYLNKAYFGGGAYGIDAASRKFFDHDISTLDIPEAAMLAGLVKAPSDYSPTADPKAAEDRMRTVLRLMNETRQNASADPDMDAPVITITNSVRGRNGTRHFIDWIEPQVEQYIPDMEGQIDVYTTLDTTMQEQAQSAAEKNVPANAQTAIISMEENGSIKAMVGGLDYASSTYNRATQARRQPGSSFKLFVYLTAIESGFGPQSRVFDGPLTIGAWTPQNSSGRYSGNLPLKSAFAFSLNTVAARLGQKVGTERVAQMGYRLGISTNINTDPSMVLGTMDVRLIDMTRAYAIVANSGLSVIPHGIKKIEQNGKTVFEEKNNLRQIMVSKDTAATMTSLLRAVVDNGTAGAAQIGRPVAGKTGTTNENKDGWFIGFSSGIITGVWVGRDDAKPIYGLEGGKAPARIFASLMREAVKGRPSGFETIDPPKINGINLAGTSAPKTKSDTPKTEQTSISEVVRDAPIAPPKPPPASREGQSRAIRPDESN